MHLLMVRKVGNLWSAQSILPECSTLLRMKSEILNYSKRHSLKMVQ